mmetsp:Transcript_117875/g.338018  ORF Transcript_117875/g.338018 Transcript_117875/m.338018 type:complete len:143 (+) Transcript_117875:121-549(+)
MTDQVEMDSSGHQAGTHPQTMDDLRQECALLRSKVQNLEAEKADLEAAVREWRTWYAQSYRPQIEYLDTEVSRLCSFAPQQLRAGSQASPFGSPASSKGFLKSSSGPLSAAPPGLRRVTSEPRVRRSVKVGGQRTSGEVASR